MTYTGLIYPKLDGNSTGLINPKLDENDKDNYWCSDQERKLDYLIKRIDRVQYISDLIPNPQKKWTNIEIIYIFYLNKKKNTKISVQ